ncbi:MAG TPA: DUF3568 family protein [Planctomycetota bacterium]|nr:DUF3568 family protein [Planctomycetota bacterium]HRR78557.1 DUF3568 family protein [Planctomycetota bacterium]HRT94814.1 DUF3568 family protein [Planctomycetota bacterium]
MRTRLTVSAALAAVLSLGTAGCPAILVGTGAAMGAGALVWQSGWLRGNISEPIERVHRAAKSAVADFHVTLESDSLKPVSGVVDGTMPDGRRIVVETARRGDRETQVRIRVGFWGDQAVSLRIFEQIKKHL